MGKKSKKAKRKQKKTVYISLEGKRERGLYDYLTELYRPKENNINITPSPIYGGSSDRILSNAFGRESYKKVYAWFDEDDPLSLDIKQSLAKCWKIDEREIEEFLYTEDRNLQKRYNLKMEQKPVLIVSNPLSIEGLIIKVLNTGMPILENCSLKEQKKKLKSSFSGMVSCGRQDLAKEIDYYKKNLTQIFLEERSKVIDELELILSIFGK